MQKKLRIRDIARLIGVDPVSVRRWCDAGKGPSGLKTPGGVWIFERDAVEQWLKNLEQPSEPRPEVASATT